jgi:hypothetical protein
VTAQIWRNIALHSAGAAIFGFVMPRFVLGASLEVSLLMAVLFGMGAAWIAWQQSQRIR